jgi:DNA-directed RNA polymerase subunit beta'
VGAHLAVDEGEKIKAGHVLAKIPRTMGKSRDITGGLPRVTELFEARNPSNPAVVSEIDGVVTYGGIKRGNREIFIESRDGVQKRYLVPLSKHILVQDNDFVKAGQPLSDGSITPSDILLIKGPTAVQEYLVNEIQEVYRLQGVKINDKHIEAIVSQMMQKVEIIDPGDTNFLPGEYVDKFVFREENDAVIDKKVVVEAGDSPTMKPGQIITAREFRDENSVLRRKDQKLVEVRDALAAVSRPTLQGITQASLKTESWLSAASFQETTKVLSEAAIRGKTDWLMGMKENVIVGHLIPAGTGQRKFNDIIVTHKDEYSALTSSESRTKEKELQD